MSTDLKNIFMQIMMESFKEEAPESEELLSPEEYLHIAKSAAEDNGDNEMIAIIDQSENILQESFIEEHSFLSLTIALAVGILIGKFGLDYASAKSLIDDHKNEIQHVATYTGHQQLSKKDECIQKARNELAKSMCGWLTSDDPDKVRQQMFRR